MSASGIRTLNLRYGSTWGGPITTDELGGHAPEEGAGRGVGNQDVGKQARHPRAGNAITGDERPYSRGATAGHLLEDRGGAVRDDDGGAIGATSPKDNLGPLPPRRSR
eukprot:2314658-Pyramimonas_sp.AAC.1